MAKTWVYIATIGSNSNCWTTKWTRSLPLTEQLWTTERGTLVRSTQCRTNSEAETLHYARQTQAVKVPSNISIAQCTLQKMRWDYTTSGVGIAHQLHFPPWWFRNVSRLHLQQWYITTNKVVTDHQLQGGAAIWYHKASFGCGFIAQLRFTSAQLYRTFSLCCLFQDTATGWRSLKERVFFLLRSSW